MMQKRRLLIGLLVLTVAVSFIKQFVNTGHNSSTAGNSTKYDTEEFNRQSSHIIYSKHARCRMDCRHVDETEVQDILNNGKINYTKSDLKQDACHQKYALEGDSKDHQHLRIIFAPCNQNVTVVTVIDLKEEWTCDCD